MRTAAIRPFENVDTSASILWGSVRSEGGCANDVAKIDPFVDMQSAIVHVQGRESQEHLYEMRSGKQMSSKYMLGCLMITVDATPCF